MLGSVEINPDLFTANLSQRPQESVLAGKGSEENRNGLLHGSPGGVNVVPHQLLARDPLVQTQEKISCETHTAPISGCLDLENITSAAVKECGASSPEAVSAVEVRIRARGLEELLQVLGERLVSYALVNGIRKGWAVEVCVVFCEQGCKMSPRVHGRVGIVEQWDHQVPLAKLYHLTMINIDKNRFSSPIKHEVSSGQCLRCIIEGLRGNR